MERMYERRQTLYAEGDSFLDFLRGGVAAAGGRLDEPLVVMLAYEIKARQILRRDVILFVAVMVICIGDLFSVKTVFDNAMSV